MAPMMKSLVCGFALAIFYSAVVLSEHAQGSELVQFNSAPIQPSEFQKRRAKEAGKTLAAVPGAPLEGYLVRPDGPGPFPAVILMHRCRGISQAIEGVWSERLSSWGYVALAVDSFRTRGIKDNCTTGLVGRVYDAYGALDYLAGSPFVDTKRVAVVGFSDGGSATLGAVQLGAAEGIMDRQFEAAVAFYPPCADSSGDMAVPTLILAGELDDWT